MQRHRNAVVSGTVVELVPFVVDLVGDPLTKRIKPG